MGVKAIGETGDATSRLALEPLIWRAMPEVAMLEPGALHLWRIRTDERGMDFERALASLGERQRARALAMRHQAQRERYIRAQAGLRAVLSRYLARPPEALSFRRGAAGKPYLADADASLYFNLSTTGDLALVGLSADTGPEAELGVDCEWMRPRVDMLAVARRMFAPEVIRRLEQTPERERMPYFYRAWTALEADAKADGRGLFRPRPSDATPPVIAHGEPEPGYIAAIARARLPPQVDWLTYDLTPG